MAWDLTAKNVSTQTTQTKVGGRFFLLQEILDYILQENNYRILLSNSIEWSDNSKNTSGWININKN